jgi:hypothetical protein
MSNRVNLQAIGELAGGTHTRPAISLLTNKKYILSKVIPAFRIIRSGVLLPGGSGQLYITDFRLDRFCSFVRFRNQSK